MRIAFDYQIFSALEYGGIARYLCEVGKELAHTKDIDLKVIAPFYKNFILKESSDQLSISGTHFISPKILAKGCAYLNPLFFKLGIQKFQPDIIHQTYYWQANKPREYFKGKVVLTVYDMIHEKFPKSFKSDDPTTQLKKNAVRHADHIFCISKQTQSDLIELFKVPPEKTTVTYLAHSDFFNTASVENIDHLLKKPFFLYVGPRHGYKNYSTFLKAFSNSEKIKNDFEIICAGGGKFSSQELEELGTKGLMEKVKFFPSDDRILKALYQRATAFVYPSLYEGFGIPPLEAMASSCPVICGNTGSIPEVVGNAAIMCEVESSDSIQAAMELIANDTSKRQDLITLGRNQTKQFSWQKCAKETSLVYTKLLSE